MGVGVRIFPFLMRNTLSFMRSSTIVYVRHAYNASVQDNLI